MTTASTILSRLKGLGNSQDAEVCQWFFKTGPGQYGEGDRFIGIRVPKLRAVVKEVAATADERAVLTLLASPIHEARLVALLIWVSQFESGTSAERSRIYRQYLAHTDRINNWDLVDASAPAIVGGQLLDRSRRSLFRLAKSASLWERRIAILATFTFIRRGEFADALTIADQLLQDPHDLIHKAVGWMLREVGKRDQPVLESFLASRCHVMPRTMLRYAIERLQEPRRQAYLRAGRGLQGAASPQEIVDAE